LVCCANDGIAAQTAKAAVKAIRNKAEHTVTRSRIRFLAEVGH
jgi:hypothetical protein